MAAELTYIGGCRGLAEILRMLMTVGDIEVSNSCARLTDVKNRLLRYYVSTVQHSLKREF